MSLIDTLIKKIEELTKAVNSIRSSSKKINKLSLLAGDEIYVAASNGNETGKVLLPRSGPELENIIVDDLLITQEFQTLINSLPNINLVHAKCIIRGKTLGISIYFQNVGIIDTQLFGESESIFVMFTTPISVLSRLNSETASLFPQYKLNNSDPVSNYSSYQTFFENSGVIKHQYGLTLTKESFTSIYGEFNSLNI